MFKNLFIVNQDSLNIKQRWSALVVLSISLFVIVMDMTILIMALPNMVNELKATAVEQLWIVDVYSLALAGLIVTMSYIGDIWGRKKILLLGFLLFGIASFLILFITNPIQVIGVRTILGIAGAMIMPTTLSMIRTIFTNPKERAIALSVWAGITGFGSILGPIIGGLLLEKFTWHSTFLINVPISILSVIVGLFILPEYKSKKNFKFDYLSAIISMFSMVAIVWSIKSFTTKGIHDEYTWIIFTFGLFLISVFIQRNLKSKNPLLDLELFKNKSFTAGILTALIAIFSMSAVLLLITQWLQLIEGLTPLKAGIYLLPMAIGEILSTIISPWIAKKIGARLAIVGGLLISSVGFIYLYFLPTDFSYLTILPTLILVGLGIGSLAVASALIMSTTSIDKAGSAAAIEETVYDLGSVLGIAILGSISTIIYRNHLNIHSNFSEELNKRDLNYAHESITNTIETANKYGLSNLNDYAKIAFNYSLENTSLIAGISIFIISIIIFTLIPKNIDITKEN